jgi:heme/copper-type cytochrome/quinol oxidase subunit 3
MRKLLIAATLLLSVSGLLIAFAHLLDPQAGMQKIMVLAHIWIGVAYLVIFPLYAWDHISTNRRWLKAFRALTASGLLQLTCGILVLLSGIVLLAYGGAYLRGLRAVHHWVTYPLLGALAWHYLSPKRWKAVPGAQGTRETNGG